MFGFNRKSRPEPKLDYQTEYRRLLRELGDQISIGMSPWEQVVYSMSIIDREMNGNGGANWTETGYTEYLDDLRNHLTAETHFSDEQLAKIRWSLDEIIACGKELVEMGESRRNATGAVDYLILRVVDWCRWNPKSNEDI
jgi:hypothetical protein